MSRGQRPPPDPSSKPMGAKTVPTLKSPCPGLAQTQT